MPSSAEEILNRKGGDFGPKIEDYLGQVITVVDCAFVTKQFPSGPADAIEATIVNSAGEESTFSTFAAAVVGKCRDLQEGGFLPIDVRVTSYPGQYGKLGYDINPV
jgi:hypothetical protein